MIFLWLDDLRPAPKGWQWVKTIEDAKILMETGFVSHASLDNDLGEDQAEGRKLLLWMAEFDRWPKRSIAVHSANPVARDYMTGMIERYAPHHLSR